MTNKNLPHKSDRKDNTGTNPTDQRTNETPARSNGDKQPAKDGDRRGAEGTTMDRGNTSTVPNPGRDITTGGTGGDGTNRKMPNNSTTGAAATDTDTDEDAVEVDDEKEEELKA